MLRVLVVTNLYPPHAMGGYELSCHDVVERFRAAGHEVEVLTTTTRLPGVVDTVDDRVHRELPWYWSDHEIEQPSWGGAWRVERETARIVSTEIERFAPDVISVWNLGAMSMRVVAEVGRSGVPVVYVVCDDWLDYGPRIDGWRRRLRWVGLRRVPDVRHAARFVFVSTRTKQRAEQATGWSFTGSQVIGSGIDLDDFPVLPTRDEAWGWRLLYVGRLDPRKGVDVAVRALSLLPAEATLRLVGTGSDEYVTSLRALADELGVADRVRVESLPRAQVASAYTTADALLFPPVWEEPFGLVPLEAMACATPVVATPSGGSADFLGHEVNSLLFARGDAAGAAAAVRRLADDATLRRAIVTGGRITVREHTADRYATRLEAVHAAAAAAGRR